MAAGGSAWESVIVSKAFREFGQSLKTHSEDRLYRLGATPGAHDRGAVHADCLFNTKGWSKCGDQCVRAYFRWQADDPAAAEEIAQEP
jgi:hypothetical protein